MARGRMINRKIGRDHELAKYGQKYGPWALVFHHRLIAFIDKQGVAPGDPNEIKGLLFHHDQVGVKKCQRFVSGLAEFGLAVPFEHEQVPYLYFPSFFSNQIGFRADKEKAEYPPYLGAESDQKNAEQIRPSDGKRPSSGRPEGEYEGEIQREGEQEREHEPEGERECRERGKHDEHKTKSEVASPLPPLSRGEIALSKIRGSLRTYNNGQHILEELGISKPTLSKPKKPESRLKEMTEYVITELRLDRETNYGPVISQITQLAAKHENWQGIVERELGNCREGHPRNHVAVFMSALKKAIGT